MKLKLSITERLYLVPIFPEKSSFEKNILAKDIVKKVGLNQEDVTKYDIKETEGGKLRWNFIDGSDVEEFEFTDKEISLIKEILRTQNESNILHTNLNDVYEKLILN